MKIKSFGIYRAVSALLALITAFAAAFTCLSVNAKALDANSARQGVVAVVFYLKNPEMRFYDPNTLELVAAESLGDELQFSHGSGFFVGKTGENPQYIVTNHHVVDDYIDADEGGRILIQSGMYNGYIAACSGYSCEMRIYYDENDYDVAYIDCYGDRNKVDLAVLKLRNPTDKRKALQIASVSEDNVGDTVYTIGYPGNADNVLTSASKYGINDSSVHKGSFVRIAMNDKGVERISTDATIQHGNSGGPLVNENGQVIGVNTNGIVNASDLEIDNYSISSSTLTDFLSKNNIPFEKASTGSAALTVVIIIIAVIVVAAAAVAVVMIMKKNSAKPASAAGSAPAAAPAPAAQNGSNATIVCEKGLLAGRTFPIGSSVIMGRDTQKCGICFPVDAKGISGVHCEIRKTAKGYEIIDRGSSYGTLLGSGQKLTPDVPVFLPDGTYFSLGSAEQLFQIKY